MDWTLDVGAAGIGLIGVGLALLANSRAKNANDIAKGALVEARRANQFAEDANKLSEKANASAERMASQQAEDWLVDWRVQWQKERTVLVLTNAGGDVAYEVTVVVDAKEFHRVHDGLGDVAAGGQVEIPLLEIGEKRAAHLQKEDVRVRRLSGSGISASPSVFGLRAQVTIRWSTGSGRQMSIPDEVMLR